MNLVIGEIYLFLEWRSMFCQWRYALSVGVYLGSESTSRPVRMYLSCGSMSCPVGARLVLWELSRPVGVSTVGELEVHTFCSRIMSREWEYVL